MRYRIVLITVWTIVFVTSLVGSDGPDSHGGKPLHYSLIARVIPDSAFIAVRCSINLDLQNRHQDKLAFSLYSNFDIDSLTVEGQTLPFVDSLYTPSRDHPAEKRVIVKLPPGLRQKRVDLVVGYRGTMLRLPEFNSPEADSLGYCLDDRIDTNLVELGGNSSWYPSFRQGNFDIDFSVSLPSQWDRISSGEGLGDTEYGLCRTTRWRSKDEDDISLVAFLNFKRKAFPCEPYTVLAHYWSLPDTFVVLEAGDLAAALCLFDGLLGPPSVPYRTLHLVYSPRGGSGGYCRNSMIVYSENNLVDDIARYPHYAFFAGTAHESSHLWWNFGTDQGTWINETFADYYMLVALESIISTELYSKFIRSFLQDVNALPKDALSLATVPSSNYDNGGTIRYRKGALMLHAFRKAMGDSAFFKACRDFYVASKSKRTSTKDFVSFWNKRLGTKRDLIHRWLYSGGGLPDTIFR